MVARVLLAVCSPIAISSCSPTSESSRLPVAGLTAQEETSPTRQAERRKGGKAEGPNGIGRDAATLRPPPCPPVRRTALSRPQPPEPPRGQQPPHQRIHERVDDEAPLEAVPDPVREEPEPVPHDRGGAGNPEDVQVIGSAGQR